MIETKSFSSFTKKIDLEINVGRFVIKTIHTPDELQQAFRLRYQVFQVEIIGLPNTEGEDHDQFDFLADHLAIFDLKTKQMIATCRLNCSLFAKQFYSEQEFNCAELITEPETKLELGRVCVHRDFRKGIVIMLLWKALADYMSKTETRYLFGCGSVATLDPHESAILYRYLQQEGKVTLAFNINPTDKYRSRDFNICLAGVQRLLTDSERERAQKILPPLCRSYFDIGCYTPCAPAFDHDFKCIDFLTILDMTLLDPKVRHKMMGTAE